MMILFLQMAIRTVYQTPDEKLKSQKSITIKDKLYVTDGIMILILSIGIGRKLMIKYTKEDLIKEEQL